MNNFFKIPLLIFLVIPLIGLSLAYGGNVPFSAQKELYSIMLAIASIVLAITGIWIAIVFPERLRGNIDAYVSYSTMSSHPIGIFFKPLVYSTVVVIVAFLTLMVGHVASAIPFFLKFKEIGRAISLTILMSLGFISIWSLLLTISLANDIKSTSDENEVIQKTIQDYIEPDSLLTEEQLNKIKDPD